MHFNYNHKTYNLVPNGTKFVNTDDEENVSEKVEVEKFKAIDEHGNVFGHVGLTYGNTTEIHRKGYKPIGVTVHNDPEIYDDENDDDENLIWDADFGFYTDSAGNIYR